MKSPVRITPYPNPRLTGVTWLTKTTRLTGITRLTSAIRLTGAIWLTGTIRLTAGVPRLTEIIFTREVLSVRGASTEGILI